MLINHASKQVTAKIVYYGAGLSGKTTNLQYIFSVTHPRSRGELVSMETEIERTIFFDLLPMNVGTIKGYMTKFQLYTVPGQIFYDSTRKLVLRGADGIVFVVDSQELMRTANIESLANLQENIGFYGGRLTDMPLVFQYNKRDLKNIMSIDQMDGELNQTRRPYSEAVAKTGEGVIETLRKISNLTLIKIRETLEQVEGGGAKGVVSFDMQPPSGKEHLEVDSSPFRRVSPDDRELHLPSRPLLTELASQESDRTPMNPPVRPPIQPEMRPTTMPESPRETLPQEGSQSPRETLTQPPRETLTQPPRETLTQPPAGMLPREGSQPAPRAEPITLTVSKPPVRLESPSGASSPAGPKPAAQPSSPGDGIIRKAARIKAREFEVLVEVKGKNGELLTSFLVETPEGSRKVNIVLDLER